jgi:hypothetical protein
MYWSQFDGVYFVEGELNGRPIATLNSEINKFFSQNHLKTLDHLKAQMAREAKRLVGNTIWSFKYVQRSRFLKSIFGMDDVSWHGSGVVGLIDPKSLPEKRNN